MKEPLKSANEIYPLLANNPSITTDSRDTPPGSIFFALRGEHFDGNLYAATALAGGASWAIVDDPGIGHNERHLLVDDVLKTLQELAVIHRRSLKAKVLGITGSNGKTTTKELVSGVLSQKFKTIATTGNLNNHIGVPLTILRTPLETEMLIVEMGANHVGEIRALCNIADPDYGILTNIGHAHLEGFGSFEGVVQAKGELYDHLSEKDGALVFLHNDDSLLASMAAARNLLTYTYGSRGADIHGYESPEGLLLNLIWDQGHQTTHIHTQLTGGYNSPNILAAIAAGRYFGVEDRKIIDAIETYTPANHRSQVIETEHNHVIADCYNANPDSMTKAIMNFCTLVPDGGLMILGDMLELGQYSEDEHLGIIRLANSSGHKTAFVGKHFFALQHVSPDLFFEDADQLVEWIENFKPRGLKVLVKGSRGIRLERVLPFL